MREPRRARYLAPATGDDTDVVIETAIETLASLRGFHWQSDAATRLHLLTSLMARDQDCSWAQIGDLLGTTRASAQQRYRGLTAINRTPLNPD